MDYQFKKHFTLEEARALLPEVRAWFDQIESAKSKLESYDERIRILIAEEQDQGGTDVNNSLKLLAEIQEILHHFHTRGIHVKDLDRGLIDFPSLRHGQEIFLCWEKGEDDIEFWHAIDDGFAGRHSLE